MIGLLCSNYRTLGDISPYIPPDSASKTFFKKSNKMLAERQKIGKSRQDVFTHLLGEDNETGSAFTQFQLLANAQVLIVAGSGEFAIILLFEYILMVTRYHLRHLELPVQIASDAS
jgi:hypothetical protein